MSLGDLIIRLCDAGFGAVEAARRLLGRPKVGTIATSELQAAMSSGDSPVLVDVRYLFRISSLGRPRIVMTGVSISWRYTLMPRRTDGRLWSTYSEKRTKNQTIL